MTPRPMLLSMSLGTVRFVAAVRSICHSKMLMLTGLTTVQDHACREGMPKATVAASYCRAARLHRYHCDGLGLSLLCPCAVWHQVHCLALMAVRMHRMENMAACKLLSSSALITLPFHFGWHVCHPHGVLSSTSGWVRLGVMVLCSWSW